MLKIGASFGLPPACRTWLAKDEELMYLIMASFQYLNDRPCLFLNMLGFGWFFFVKND